MMQINHRAILASSLVGVLFAGILIGRHWPITETESFVSTGAPTPHPFPSLIPGRSASSAATAGQAPGGATTHASLAALAAMAAAQAGDMPGALRGLVALKDPAARHEAVRAFIASLSASSLAEVFNAFESMESAGDFRQHQNTARAAASTWELIVDSMVKRGPEDFLDLKLRQAGEQASETEFESVLSAWAERDLNATVAYFNANIRHLKPSELQGAAGHLASDFLRLDPERAVAWFETLPAEVRDHCSTYALTRLSQDDPEAAARLVANHEGLANRHDMARHAAQRWAAADPAQAFEWARSLPATLAAPALRGVIDQWMENDYDAASHQIEALDPALRSAALPGLVERSPDTLLPVLAAQLGEPSSDPHQTSAATSLASRWAEADPTAASEWLVQTPSSPLRDAAIRGFTERLVMEDPASAFEWAAVIVDPDIRSDTLDAGIRDWLDRDPEAAREWVHSSTTLSPDDRTRLLRRAGR
jgi:hypothetical protein